MSKNSRVFNLTRKFSLKHRQAEKAVEQCACAWVEYGVSIRDLTLAESIQARNEQAKTHDPLPNMELTGLVFRQPVNAATTRRERAELVSEANRFFVEATA